jgi:opacity protein-like surface antigen
MKEPTVVTLPALSQWPRYLSGRSPWYGHISLSPYVGQMGILSDIERAGSGSGFGAVFGYDIPLFSTTSLGFEMRYGQSSHHNPSSDVSARATRLGAGLRMSFSIDDKLRPFFVAGTGTYSMAFDELDSRFDLSGPGFYFGGGGSYAFKDRFSLKAGMCMHIWEAAEDSGNGGTAQTLTVNIGTAFSF